MFVIFCDAAAEHRSDAVGWTDVVAATSIVKSERYPRNERPPSAHINKNSAKY